MNIGPVEIVVILAVFAAIVAAIVIASRRRRSQQLQERFGPEYDRTVEGSGKKREAERELAQRAERRKELDIRPLDPARRDEFAAEWRDAQEAFVDMPAEAVSDANRLVERVMQERGYPTGDFDQMSRDVSVDHANVVEEYRSAHEISLLNDRKQATTEQLRRAMVHYRSLFADLLDAGEHDRRGTDAPYPDEDRVQQREGQHGRR